MLPRVFRQLLLGGGPQELRPKRPAIQWAAPEGAKNKKLRRHPAEGGFVVVDPEEQTLPPPVAIEHVDQAAAQQMADEIRQLSASPDQKLAAQ